MMHQVGKDEIPLTSDHLKNKSAALKRKKNTKTLSYADCRQDINGWVDAALYLPVPYDLLWAKTKDRTYSGWWNGQDYECPKMKIKKRVLYWKHRKEMI